MVISVFDLFKIGIGPSSSHTVGPMRAARQFVKSLHESELLSQVTRVKAEMYGSLGATGKGHGTPTAVMLGLEGEQPETVDVPLITHRIDCIRQQGHLYLDGVHSIGFKEKTDLILHRRQKLPFHPNGMIFTAFNIDGKILSAKTYYSIGGGFVVDEITAGTQNPSENTPQLPYPFNNAKELLQLCETHHLSVSDIMRENEKAWRSELQTRTGLHQIWATMQECVHNGVSKEGELPGGLKVKRRAANLYHQLMQRNDATSGDSLAAMDWVTVYALAVNEENAAGGRVVTAPTNGAAGIIPAVLHYYVYHTRQANEEGVERFLLTAAAIGYLFKKNASISGAEVGCQGEVGSACSMAAGALTEVLGGSPLQVENAAEIGMEHNLGLTCDPIGGLVQIPCIERNAIAAVKAIHAARLALQGNGSHLVSLDKVIRTMRNTGRDMQDKYKETSRGGLAVDVVEVPVNIIEC